MKKSAKQLNRRDKTPIQVNRLETAHEHNRIEGQHPMSHSKMIENLDKERGKKEGWPEVALFNEKN